MKIIKDRIVQYPNRYQLTNVNTQEVLGTFDFEEVPGEVTEMGTEVDAALFKGLYEIDSGAHTVSNNLVAGGIYFYKL